MSKTRVAVQSRGPGNTHREREGTYLNWAAPSYACVWLCALHMQTQYSYSKQADTETEAHKSIAWTEND